MLEGDEERRAVVGPEHPVHHFDRGLRVFHIAGTRWLVDRLDPLAEDPADLVDEEVEGVAFAAGDVGQEEG